MMTLLLEIASLRIARAAAFPGRRLAPTQKIYAEREGPFTSHLHPYQSPSPNEWITTPERSLGSNHVVLGGMMLPVSAISINCCIETG